MKRTTQCLLAIALAGSMCAAAAQEASKAPAQPRKKRVAIIDFEYGTVRTAVAGLFGTDIDVGRGICDLLVKQLVNDGSYTVVERRMLDKILAEQNFSTSDRANPATAAKIGKILGLDAIIVGSITQFGGETQQTNVGGVGAARGPFGFGGIGHKKSKAIVSIDAAKAKLQARTVVVEGLVAAVEGDTVVLNVGAKSGVKVGDQLSIERVSKEIKDPATGNVIRRMTSKIGVIQVTEVDEVSAVAKIVAGSGFKVDDMAKTVTQ